MRRISLALALLGAAAAGCGGSTPSNTGGARGVAEGTFTITIQNGQNQIRRDGVLPLEMLGGSVASSPAGIACAAGSLTGCSADFVADAAVVLTATPDTGKVFFGWAGDCTGASATCELTGKADKYVVAMFGTENERAYHANFSSPDVHVAEWINGSLRCTQCHGANLQGQGIAVACNTCHATGGHVWPITDLGGITVRNASVGHAAATGHGSAGCGRCHTGAGFRDYIGADGTAANYLDGTALEGPAPLAAFPDGIKCDACHNTTTVLGGGTLNQIRFPLANVVTTDGITAICGQCHTGARGGYEVAALAAKIAAGGAATDDDQLTTGNSVVRAHYLPAASTLLGSEAQNWYQYPGMIYTARNAHGGKGSCTDCHNAHNGKLPYDGDIAAKCGTCHFDEVSGAPVANFIQLEESRQFGFEGDIDGDAVEESLKHEIDGLAATLMTTMQAYAVNVAGTTGICAASNRFYIQVNTTDACATGANAVQFNKFTPRLLRAGYNYLMWENDVGAWAHNPRYTIEVLFDTIADLNVGLGANAVPFAGKRAFNGHFGAAEDASPYSAMVYHFEAPQGFTSAACYQCHGGNGGLTAYLAGMPAALPAGATSNKVTALQCSTCHVDGDTMKGVRSDIGTVYFPPQKGNPPVVAQNVVSFASTALPKSFALCGTCHSGRENGSSLDIKIGTKLEPEWTISFTNPHYLGAAGVLLGTEAKVLYEYAGKTYAGYPINWKVSTFGNAPGPYGSPHGAECTGCHLPKASKHTFEVDLAYCATCHVGNYALEPKKLEVEEAAEELYAAIQTYATAAGKTVCYNGASHPYWFADDDSDGTCATAAGSALLNSKALKAAYNFKWAHAEPGAYAHNFEYMMQALYDSIVDLGGTPSFGVHGDATRPAPVP